MKNEVKRNSEECRFIFSPFLSLPEQNIFSTASVDEITPFAFTKEFVGKNSNEDYELRPVTGIFERESNDVWVLKFDNDDSIGVTAAHPLYSLDYNTWREAAELTIGEKVLTKNGYSSVISKEKLLGEHTVYNLKIREFHNFLVGKNSIVVHNSYSHLDLDALENARAQYRSSDGLNLPDDPLIRELVEMPNELFSKFKLDVAVLHGRGVTYRLDLVKAWEFLFEGATIRVKVNVLEGISTALQRGIKDIPEVVSHANHPNIITYTVKHIFRGHGANGGRHHISALIADNSRKLTNRLKETTDGFYEAIIKRSDGTTSTKSFWPDTWDENKIMDELKHVMANNPINITGNTWEGFTATGQKINYYVKASDNSIISAFPVLD